MRPLAPSPIYILTQLPDFNAIVIRDHIRGKVASYWASAVADAQIADHLLHYVRSGERPPQDGHITQRAHRLIDTAPPDQHAQRVAVRAFTERRLNGQADAAFAAQLDRLARTGLIDGAEPYDSRDVAFRGLFFPWTTLYMGRFDSVERYLREHAGLALTLSPREVVAEIIAVQRVNIAANHAVTDHLHSLNGGTPSDHPKVQHIGALVAHARRPEVFLRAAIRTQIAASRWDWLFVQSLRARFLV
jgi:hypothetical protein